MRKIFVPLLVLLLCISLAGCDSEKKAAKDSFNTAVDKLIEKNDQLDKSIQSAQTVIDSGETPLDESAVTNLKKEISKAKKSKIDAPDMPDGTNEINAAAAELNEVDYSSQLTSLQEKQELLETSIQQFKQLTNPKEEFLIKRLKTIGSIDNIKPVTENNDPNGNLNKAGGYTACVYFTSSQVNQNDVYGKDSIEKGTDGGGAVEVYKTVSDAEKRNAYLSAFDGNGFLDSGSHSIVGTVIIRTSSELTASQQKKLENRIYNALVKLK